jgi:hypothetical protein
LFGDWIGSSTSEILRIRVPQGIIMRALTMNGELKDLVGVAICDITIVTIYAEFAPNW